MSHLFWLDQERLNRIKRMFPKSRGVARVLTRPEACGAVLRQGYCLGIADPLHAGCRLA